MGARRCKCDRGRGVGTLHHWIFRVSHVRVGAQYAYYTRGVGRGRLVSSVLRSSAVVGVSQLGKDSDSMRGLGVGRTGVRKNSYSTLEYY